MACIKPKWSGFILGCFSIAISGFTLDYGVIINDIKDVYNLTQTQANLPGSIGLAGFQLGMPAGILLEKVGYQWTHLLAMVVSATACFLLTSMSLSPRFYHDNAALMDLYFFLQGFGSVFMYMSALKVNMNNFSDNHRGKVVGIIGAALWAGPAAYTLMYNGFFHEGQHLGYYFFLVGILYIVINVICAIFLKEEDKSNTTRVIPQPNSIDRNGSFDSVNLNSSSEDQRLIPQSNNALLFNEGELTGKKLLSSPTFYVIAISFCLGNSAQLALVGMNGAIAHSFDEDYLVGIIGIMGPITTIAGKVLMGLVSDKFINRVPRVFYLTGVTVFLCVFCILSIWFSEPLFIPNILLNYIAIAVYMIIIPVLIGEYFGMTYFARNYGALLMMQMGFTLFYSWLAGWLYDREAKMRGGGNNCYGEECFTTTFIALSLTNIVISVLLAFLCIKQMRIMKSM